MAHAKLPKNLNPVGFFFKRIQLYAGPYKWALLLLAFLNVIMAILSLMSTVATAGVLYVITGRYKEAQRGETIINLDNINFSELFQLGLQDLAPELFAILGFSDGQEPFQIILYLSIMNVVFLVATSLLRYLAGLLGFHIGLKAGKHAQMDFFEHLLGLSFRFYHQEKTAELVSRMENDAKTSVASICDIIPSFITETIRLFFYVIITYNASPFLLIVVICAGSFQMGVVQFVVKPVRKLVRKGLNLAAELRGMVTEILGNIRIVKAFGSEKHEVKRVDSKQSEVISNIFKNTAIQGAVKPINTGASNAAIAIIICGASYEYFVSGRLSSADTVLMFSYIASQLFGPVQSLTNAYLSMHQMYESSKEVYRVSRIEPDVITGSNRRDRLNGAIELKNVSFSYTNIPVINNLSLIIPRGQTTAIVGPSGAGKSTLIDLLLRFYDPISGIIMLDNKDIRTLDVIEYRKMFGVVTQETFLFNSTVRDNLCYGRSEFSDEEIKRAIRIANAEKFLLSKQNGDFEKAMGLLIGDRGVKFSGGQRQRLSIARAVMSSPEVLVLDEATSSLDSESERDVQAAIEEATRGLTSVIIAHRLSTVMRADQIVVMQAGEIVGLGKHHELLERCKLYKKLVDLQFGKSRDETETISLSNV
ncbi:MAG: ABC transporter ATP-binding protein [Bacteroidota bacterium]